ncbi:CAT RNA binding domain-containing protein [uncultured Dubosiella sp.]|uniref:CAT RNA binding domain-containing protein n=1 Tax=uncultured Dubosiella sp. TaxID=1937011 RepID=UPI0025EFA70B|nr:CAT RNA binding domain-containing protein [uncultured Dubosiella sp.]
MKIKSILNNSALIALNDENQELVLIGKGISFQKHPGDRVDTTKIEKEFICGKETTNELMELLNEIPSRYFELTEVIVRHIRRKLNQIINLHFIVRSYQFCHRKSRGWYIPRFHAAG